jgi:16S rRNA (adenine1518-N6/adenine1519-N6)-dimethyltransferase
VTSLRSLTRAQLADRGLRPRRARGQHFLVDPRVRDVILEAAGIGPESTVLEIGPGTGILTAGLLARGATVYAIELDRGLAALLREALGAHPRLVLWVGDVLRFDLAAHLASHPARGRMRVVANIPYSITSPLLLRLLEGRAWFEALFLTVQREVAARLGASPGSKAYGALTLACRYRAEVHPLLAIPRSAFDPVPEVDSMLVRFDLLDAPRVAVHSPVHLFDVIRAAFAQRRKTLRNALRGAGWSEGQVDAALGRAGLLGGRRGETLSLEEFGRLSDALPEAEPGTGREAEAATGSGGFR